MLTRAATVVQQLCKSCRTCFMFYCMFYCMFYFTCDRSFKRAMNDDGGGSEPASRSHSQPRRRSTSEGRPSRSMPDSRSQSRRRSCIPHHGDECGQDGLDEGSLERTTTRTRGGGPCCPEPEERNCESESRFLSLIACFLAMGYKISK